MMTSNEELTPMMRQYLEIKSQYQDAFLFFRLGDFYEMFFEDARKASKILNITLTTRGTHKDKAVPMCGIPFHSVDSYLVKLIAANQKIAICEQVEEPESGKIVKRKVIRVVTPGTVIDASLLESNKNNYLAAIHKVGANFGLAFVELSTGEFKVSESKNIDTLNCELSRLNPSEILISKTWEESFQNDSPWNGVQKAILPQPDWIFEYKKSMTQLCTHFKTHSLDGFGLSSTIPGIGCAGAILHYVSENCPTALSHLHTLSCYDLGTCMALDENTKRHLELFENPAKPGTANLIQVLDHTQTPMGARLLRTWIHTPLKNVSDIKNRLDAVSHLKVQFQKLLTLRDTLSSVTDMERMIVRVACGNANPRDLLGLRASLLKIPELQKTLSGAEPTLLKTMLPFFHDFHEVTALIQQSIVSEAPTTMRDGGVIQTGFDSALDELRDISKNAKTRLLELQQKEIQKTGIKNLKVNYNNVFGYYLEVSKGQAHLAPEYFIRKQTLVNAERYITEELKELESKILGAEQKSLLLEQKLFMEVRERVAKHSEDIKATAHQVAILDTLCSLAEVSIRHRYICPDIHENDSIYIVEGRHPILESLLDPGDFITNDVQLDNTENQILLITGPNMAGKSTYLRQVALLVLLAQIGSHLPAKEAKIGIVDRIFTRVGASDDLSRGQSTFMVEMNETATILNQTTSKSLLILDEIGRGTSTFDGISIAWSVIEHLSRHNPVKAKTLFATHYHELTCLAKIHPCVKNFNIAVKEWNDEILFLHKIVPGPADKSYGIHVARLAGIPKPILHRAKEILLQLESNGIHALETENFSEDNRSLQLDLFSKNTPAIPANLQVFLERFQALNPMQMTPLQAMNVLHDLVSESRLLLENSDR
jgi:DNA mismatch repair protein MutS